MLRRSSLVHRFSGENIVQRFWSPFTVGTTGPDLKQYKFEEMISEIVHPMDFTCQVNRSSVGSKALLEDFFHVVLCGFDIVGVDVQTKSSSVSETHATGFVRLVHQRPLIGWKPATLLGAGGVPQVAEPLFHVPFVLHGEGCTQSGRLNHLSVRLSLAEAARNAGCPESVLACLSDAEALHMLATLRRANVNPSIITERTLRSVSKREDSWRSALGIL